MKHVSPLALTLAFTTLVVGCGSTSPGKTGAPVETATNECGLNSGYAGDEYCILPPTAQEGFQLHVGPSSYDDPAAVEPYLLQGGDENVRCFNAAIPEGDFHYLHQQNRMRPSSHHMLINLSSDTTLTEGPSTQCDLVAGSLGSIPGSQTPSRDFPSKYIAPEDAGIARYMPKATMATFQLHYVNLTTKPVLREAWVNLYKTTDFTQSLQSIFLVGDLGVNVPPQSRQTTTLQYTPQALTGPTRIYDLSAHMHAHGESFTVWRIHGGVKEQIYEAFDWAEPRGILYNTVAVNPAADAASKTEGGLSGLLYLEPGDSLEWACDVNNTTDAALRFANEAHTAEMCLLPGDYVSPTSGLLSGFCLNGNCFAGAPKPTG